MYCIFTLIGSLLLHVCFLIHVTFLGGNSSQIRNFKNHSRHYYLSQAIPPHYEISKKETNKVKAKTRRECVHPREATGGAYYIC